MAAAGLGVLVIAACNSTPDIPNDLRSNSGTYPGRNAKNAADDSDSEANNEGDSEQVLTGGRAPSQPPAGNDAGTPPPPPDDPDQTDASTPPPTNQCASSTTQSTCFTCCEQQNPGTVTLWNQFWDDCACAANRCGSQCAQSWCAGFEPSLGDECDTCLNNVSNACSTQADAVCKQDGTCAPLVLCDEDSGCLSKP